MDEEETRNKKKEFFFFWTLDKTTLFVRDTAAPLVSNFENSSWFSQLKEQENKKRKT